MNSQGEQSRRIFLKLGGSLITDKSTPKSLRQEVLARLAGEIAKALHERQGLQILLGHGSGSFGHVPAKIYNTRQGVSTPQEWRGFTEVWKEAAALNHHVLAALQREGLPAISLPASASLTAADGRVAAWELAPLRYALRAGLLPVIYGDVVFDRVRGGTIFSTEDLFVYLAERLRPNAILLAGIEAGVWRDFPACTELLEKITPASLADAASGLRGALTTDVTGGMASKVAEMVRLVEKMPGLKVLVFSGIQPGQVLRALSDEVMGTLIQAD
jgi:isopentenyl phosphate kinase